MRRRVNKIVVKAKYRLVNWRHVRLRRQFMTAAESIFNKFSEHSSGVMVVVAQGLKASPYHSSRFIDVIPHIPKHIGEGFAVTFYGTFGGETGSNAPGMRIAVINNKIVTSCVHTPSN